MTRAAGRRARPARETGDVLDPRELRRLAAAMADSGIQELEVERDGTRIRIVRAAPYPAPATAADPALTRDAASHPSDERARTITSPMVGTFHRAPAPGQAPFVEIGDVVEAGQVLCVVEAMKLMNEIEAEYRGHVAAILVEDGHAIEYGEPLFVIDPDEPVTAARAGT